MKKYIYALLLAAALAAVFYMKSIADSRSVDAEEFIRTAIAVMENESVDAVLALMHEGYASGEKKESNTQVIAELQENLHGIGRGERYGFPITSHRVRAITGSDGFSDVFITHAEYELGKVTYNIGVMVGSEPPVIHELRVASATFPDSRCPLRVVCADTECRFRRCKDDGEKK